jgi:hypothetical protein
MRNSLCPLCKRCKAVAACSLSFAVQIEIGAGQHASAGSSQQGIEHLQLLLPKSK